MENRYYVHKNRCVVEVTGAEENGRVPVRFLGLMPNVQGARRRGRPPTYAKGVAAAELEALTDPEVISLYAQEVGESN